MMREFTRLTVAGLATLAAVACTDSAAPSSSNLNSAALTAALSSVPLGYGELTSSFVGSPASDAPLAGLWIGGGREAEFDRGGEHGGLMGGGLDDSFTGAIPFDGRGGHHGPFGGEFGGPFGGRLGCTGTFDAASSRVVCADVTRNGITVKRSAQYKDAAGTVQQKFDTLTTNSVNTQSA